MAPKTRPKATDFFSDEDKSQDIDVPRISQWIDDEEFELKEQTNDSDTEGVDEDDEDDNASEAGPSRRLQNLQDDLSTLPLGALRSAQRTLARALQLNDSDSVSVGPSEDDDDSSSHLVKDQDKEKSLKSRDGLTKRTNKHAPTEVTSKRPVSRRRMVVDDALPKPRDPRFMHAAGRYDPSKFKQQYDFLPGLHKDELTTLREHLKRARKLLANSPSNIRTNREEEVKRLERAVKKAESAVNQDNRERVELKALQYAKQMESEKRKKGKAEWWMKRSEKKELLRKARLDAIASAGGKRAVKKALDKKQKKVNQKEKRSRPFSKNQGMEWSSGKKRRSVPSTDMGRGTKRRKII